MSRGEAAGPGAEVLARQAQRLHIAQTPPGRALFLETPMTYVVTENCIKCKYMDCVEVCPVDCFYVGENMLVINPDECIDCGVCEPECPAEAILPDSDDRAGAWAEQNRTFSAQWPNIVRKGTPPEDADAWKDKPGKAELFSPEPGKP
jgi:ferredoxin